MEDEKFDIEDEDESEGAKSWFSDNLRIIISIIIVIIIAGGVYSYSKRSQVQEENQVAQEETAEQIAGEEISNNPVETQPKEQVQQPKEQPKGNIEEKNSQTSSATISQETENSFVETAGKGDGTTHLARKALANYLEKNPDSSLTAEHKIYIEDYLSKKVGSNRLALGNSKEFQKDLIKQAIESSKQLNQKQLQNLHKYSVRVASLS